MSLTLDQISEEVVVAIQAAHDLHTLFANWRPTLLDDLRLFQITNASLWFSEERQEWYLRYRFASESDAVIAWRSLVCTTMVEDIPGVRTAAHLPKSQALPLDSIEKIPEQEHDS